MSTLLDNSVLLLGGSGVVGVRAARTLRRLHPELPLTLAGRDAARAAAAAAEIGGPTGSATIDLRRDDLGLPAGASFRAVVVLLKDTGLRSLKYAQARGLPYLSFATFLFEVGPEVALYAERPTSAPILLLGHVFGGIGTLASLHYAAGLRRIDAIAIAGIVDPDDLGGPASQSDFERQARTGPSALIRRDGAWVWASGADATRRVVDIDGVEREGQAIPLLDVVSLAVATEARSIRVDLAAREAPRADRRTEVVIEISGEDQDGAPARRRVELVDRDVYAGLSAHGAALATERLLGLVGGPPVAPGLYHPEVLIDPAHVIARLQQLGAQIRVA